MTGSADRLHRLIFLLTAGFLFGAAVLRSVISYAAEPHFVRVLLLLLAWLALFVAETLTEPRTRSRRQESSTDRRSTRWGPFFPLYLAAQTAIVVVLLGTVDSGDFYAVLFGVLSMQAMQRLQWKSALVWIALFTPLTALPLVLTYDVPQAIAFAFVYLTVDAFLAFFTFVTGRASAAHSRNRQLALELAAANREIEAYSQQIERLAATEERHRLARELHDSVTQTIFGMNLTAQSAALLAVRDRGAAAAQLTRLEELARGALAEIRTLGSELAQGADATPPALAEGGLAPALRRHVDERDLPDGLTVTIDVSGEDASLSAAEDLALFRIAQEALNNVVKHAEASRAAIRLRLSPPSRLEVEDDGVGFSSGTARTDRGMGLAGMRERAAAIGWDLSIRGAPGVGTRIIVERRPADGDAAAQRGRTE